jgi:hypothetical protein
MLPTVIGTVLEKNWASKKKLTIFKEYTMCCYVFLFQKEKASDFLPSTFLKHFGVVFRKTEGEGTGNEDGFQINLLNVTQPMRQNFRL